ncbi:MAG: UDP-3-O-[3-hydroxymyristoyl] glucosamine N-acyltransferase [Paracoccaceae bacterium]|jgi:UDP-3-O-[3-hydroxymyristoyl] glucosamine N-acyltransferase
MSWTIARIAEALGAEPLGNASLRVGRPAHPAKAVAGDLAIAMDPSYADALRASPARAALVWHGADLADLGLDAAVAIARPRVGMAGITTMFAYDLDLDGGIHPSAVIAPDAEIGEGAAIGPFVVIGARARIGKGARICAHVTIGADVVLGEDALIYPGVRIGARVTIGDRPILHAGAVIGADGFSFVTPEKSTVENAKETGGVAEARNSVWMRIHSLGAVTLGSDVEIGANTTIDRGTLHDTTVGAGTKIDNQVQIGHNVSIGASCLLCAQVGIAGSAQIGDRVVLGGKVGVADHVTIGSDVVVAASSGVASKVPPRTVVMGSPAIARDEYMKMLMAMRRLPRLLAKLGG